MSTGLQDYMGTCLRGQFPLPAEEEERRPAGPVRPQQEPPVQYSKVYSVQYCVQCCVQLQFNNQYQHYIDWVYYSDIRQLFPAISARGHE